MAADWIKVEIDTAQKPEVLKLARTLGIHKAQAFGLVVMFWGWCDKNTSDGEIIGVTEEDIDIFLSQPGFSKALQEVGWLHFDAKIPKLSVPHFDIHNSESAKKRIQKSRRQQKWREGSKDVQRPAHPRINGANVLASSTEGAEFYKGYPVKKRKDAARKAWEKLNPSPELIATIMKALEAQKRSPEWLRDGGRYIPHPATWLNERRWEDEAPPPPERRVAI